MKKNQVALTVYRTVKAANDDGASAGSPSPPTLMPLAAVRSGWDPFEVWRTRIHMVLTQYAPRGKH